MSKKISQLDAASALTGTETVVVVQGGETKRSTVNALLTLPVTFTEISDPAAPASNKAILYARDSGGGKTQLCVRFPTGAVQVIATEP